MEEEEERRGHERNSGLPHAYTHAHTHTHTHAHTHTRTWPRAGPSGGAGAAPAALMYMLKRWATFFAAMESREVFVGLYGFLFPLSFWGLVYIHLYSARMETQTNIKDAIYSHTHTHNLSLSTHTIAGYDSFWRAWRSEAMVSFRAARSARHTCKRPEYLRM